ncbi:MAG TPA: TIGR04500 family putative peptide maturation system protein [Chloroflexota bacterium]
MSAGLSPLLGETLTYLQAVVREGVAPPAARAGLRRIAQQYPEHALDLVWVEEAYDRSLHYDALVHLPGEGTISLSFSPERTLPWPLRGVQRWNDQDLLRVDGTVLTIDHAIACLDFIWGEARVARRLVDVCLIKAELERDPIVLSDAELQRAVNAFRRARRLYTAEATHQWMSDNGISPEKLERLAGDDATVARLRERVVNGRLEPYFEAHADDFATASVLRLEFAKAEDASAAFAAIQQGTTFDALALSALASDTPPRLTSAVIRRHEANDIEPLDGVASLRAASCPIDRQAPPDLATALFTAEDGDIVGPVRADKGAALLRVVAVRPAQLDGPTRAAVKDVLFEQWLAERRSSANVEWFWGTSTPAEAA